MFNSTRLDDIFNAALVIAALALPAAHLVDTLVGPSLYGQQVAAATTDATSAPRG